MADGWVDETPSGGWCWETAVPGPDLAAAVAVGLAEVGSLSGAARASLLKAVARLSGWVSMGVAHATVGVLEALEAESADRAGSGRPDLGAVEDWAVEEVATALHVAPNTASGRIRSAVSLVQRWPVLGEAVASGRLSWAQGLVIAEGVAILDGEVDTTGRDLASIAVERVLLEADRYPPARLRARLEHLVVKLDATATSRRRKRAAREQTDVGLWADRDGLATVFVRGAAPDAVALNDAIAARAKAMRTEFDAAARAARDAADESGEAEPDGTGPDGSHAAAGTGPGAGAAAGAGCAQRRTAGQWRVAAAMAAFGLQPLGMPLAALPTTVTGPGDASTAGEDSARGTATTDDGASGGASAGGAASAAAGGEASTAARGEASGVIACGPAETPVPVPAATPVPVPAPVPVPVQVRVTIDIATLLGLADDPGMLDGYGPIDADLARELAASGEWIRWVTDPVTGYLLDAGTRRLPGTALARFVKARDARCAHPSCGVRARNCDIDHVPEYRTTGHTKADELTLTCPKHNRGRDAAGWKAKPADWADPSAGPEPTWTTPLGQTYRSLTDPALPVITVPPGRVPPEHAPPPGPPDDDVDDPPF